MTISLVQTQPGHAASTTVTVTLGAPTTTGNCLIACVVSAATSTNGAVTGITLGGAAGNWAALTSAGTSGDDAITSVWADPSCAGGQTAVVVTVNSTGTSHTCVQVYEFSGIAAASVLDRSAGQDTAFTAGAGWSAGPTSSTTQAAELWLGAAFGLNTTMTGPSSPWNNAAQVTDGPGSLMAGYQIVAATGTATYAGSYSPNSPAVAAVVTLKAAAAKTGKVHSRASLPAVTAALGL